MRYLTFDPYQGKTLQTRPLLMLRRNGNHLRGDERQGLPLNLIFVNEELKAAFFPLPKGPDVPASARYTAQRTSALSARIPSWKKAVSFTR